MLNEVMYKFAELLNELPKTQEKPKEINLLPNKFSSIELDAPLLFTENVFLAQAADEDLKLLKEKKHPMKPDDMIEKAHPKEIWVSNALGNGGLVENQNEQQKVMIEVVNKMPTGNLINTYATIAEDLVKVAQSLESKNRPDLAQQVDSVLSDIFGE